MQKTENTFGNSIGNQRVEKPGSSGYGTLLFKFFKNNYEHRIWSQPCFSFPFTDIVSMHPTVSSALLGLFW